MSNLPPWDDMTYEHPTGEAPLELPPYKGGNWTNSPQDNQPVHGLAVAAMWLSIVWLFWIGSLIGAIFGYIALNDIERNPQMGGRNQAIAGLVIGLVGLGLLVLFIIVAIVVGPEEEEAYRGITVWQG